MENKMKTIFTILAITIACVVTVHAQNAAVVKIETPKSLYNKGEMVLIKISVYNSFNRSIYFNDDLPESLIITSNNQVIKPNMNYSKLENAGLVILPGKSFCYISDVGLNDFILENGTYEICLHARIKSDDGKHRILKSNVLSVSICDPEKDNSKYYLKMRSNQKYLGKRYNGYEYTRNLNKLVQSMDKGNNYYNTIYLKYLGVLGVDGFSKKEDNKTSIPLVEEFIQSNYTNLYGLFAVLLYETKLNNEYYTRNDIIDHLNKIKDTYKDKSLSEYISYRVDLLATNKTPVLSESMGKKRRKNK